MTDANRKAAYATWRFMMWVGGLGSYNEIDALVERGVLRPGMTRTECAEAMLAAGIPEGAAHRVGTANEGSNGHGS